MPHACTPLLPQLPLCSKCDGADIQTQARHANNSQKPIKTSIRPHAPTGLSVWGERRWILREIYSFPEAQSPQTSVSLGNALPPSSLQPPCSQTEEIGGLVSQCGCNKETQVECDSTESVENKVTDLSILVISTDHMWCEMRVGTVLDSVMWCKPFTVMRLKDVWGKVWPGGVIWSLTNAAGIYDLALSWNKCCALTSKLDDFILKYWTPLF